MSKFILSAFADEIDMNLNIQMDELESHEIKYIEVRGVDGKNVSELTLEEAKTIKGRLDARGFGVSAIGSPIGKINIEEDFEEDFKRFKHVIELAKIFDTRYIRMFSFFITGGKNPDDFKEEVLGRWQQYIDYAKDKDVILLHENEKDIYGDTAVRCLELLKTLNCPFVKATFDPANFVQVGQNTLEAYELLKDYIAYMHIKDARKDGEVVPAGEGIGNIQLILQKIKETGYEGFLSLEPHLGSFKGLEKFEIDDKYQKLEEGGPKTFAVATKALKDLLKEVN